MKRKLLPRVRGVVCAAFLCLVFLLVLRRADVAAECLRSSLLLWGQNVIPSLFPFMVISEIFLESSAGAVFSSALSTPMRWLFGLSGEAGCCFLLGSLCGFPVGTRSAILLYDQGKIGRREVIRMMSFSNNPGSAFVISAVGISLYGSRTVGIILYVAVILSAVAIGVMGRFFGYGNKEVGAVEFVPEVRRKSTVKLFTSAVSSSLISILTVCSYVLFFSALMGCLSSYLEPFSLPSEVLAGIYGIMEISSGAAAVSSLEPRLLSLCMCAFVLGFSGLSVHFQLMAICDGRGIPYLPFLAAKLSQGCLSALLVFLSARFLFPEICRDVTETATGFEGGSAILPLFFAAFTGICVLISVILRGKTKKDKIFKKN